MTGEKVTEICFTAALSRERTIRY